MHWKEKDIYKYFKEYKHTKEDWCVEEIPARDFPFGTVDDVVQGAKELGLDIAEELGNNMVDFRCWGKNLKQRIWRWPKNMFLLLMDPKEDVLLQMQREIDKHNSKVNKLLIRSGRRQMKGPMVDNA
ncbi:hypothetical protein BDL97_05G008500 [Sphagnum fallax]|nr:hypothetical protein BDL97_05G008500 [Sphagnum fallax]